MRFLLISNPIPDSEMPAELVTKPPPMRKSYLNKALPLPPMRPASSRRMSSYSKSRPTSQRASRPVSQRFSQALTAVISEYEIPELPKNPPPARVRHVAELRRSAAVPERVDSQRRRRYHPQEEVEDEVEDDLDIDDEFRKI